MLLKQSSTPAPGRQECVLQRVPCLHGPSWHRCSAQRVLAGLPLCSSARILGLFALSPGACPRGRRCIVVPGRAPWPGLPRHCCVILCKPGAVSEPQFIHPYNAGMTCLRWLWALREFTHRRDCNKQLCTVICLRRRDWQRVLICLETASASCRCLSLRLSAPFLCPVGTSGSGAGRV